MQRGPGNNGNIGGAYEDKQVLGVNKVRRRKEERAKEKEKRLDDGVPKHSPFLSEPSSGCRQLPAPGPW